MTQIAGVWGGGALPVRIRVNGLSSGSVASSAPAFPHLQPLLAEGAAPGPGAQREGAWPEGQ